MGTSTRRAPAVVVANVGVHDDVEIMLTMARDNGESAAITFGHQDDMTVEFSDADSLERLAAIALDGARQLRERIAGNLG